MTSYKFITSYVCITKMTSFFLMLFCSFKSIKFQAAPYKSFSECTDGVIWAITGMQLLTSWSRAKCAKNLHHNMNQRLYHMIFKRILIFWPQHLNNTHCHSDQTLSVESCDQWPSPKDKKNCFGKHFWRENKQQQLASLTVLLKEQNNSMES